MNGKKHSYDWAAYYAAAYEKERKQNVALAGKLAEAERRQEDYSDRLNRICGNPFWRMAAPLRRLCHGGGFRGKTGAGGWGAGIPGCGRFEKASAKEGENSAERAWLLRYQEEAKKQKNRYQEWINNSSYGMKEETSQEPVQIQGWTEIEINDIGVTILAYGRGMLAPEVFDKIKSCFNEKKSCMLAYGDEDFYRGDVSRRAEPWLEPCYSPDTLLAFNYWGHMIAVRRELLSEISYRSRGEAASGTDGFETGLGAAIDFYDLCLQLEEAVFTRSGMNPVKAQERICHLDGVLYHQEYTGEDLEADLAAGRFLVGATEEFLPVRREALRRRGIQAEFSCGREPDLYHIVYDTSVSGRERCARARSFEEPTAPHRVVSVVIPSKDHPELLETCLRSFRQKTDYQYYEWIVVDNGSNEQNKEKMEALQRQYGFRYLYEPMDFNFSRMCNLGVKQARGDLILLLNDDMEIIEESWLTRMAGQALQPHVGAVGAKLWYAGTEQIQHVGITNLRIGPSHKLVTFPDDRDYYYGRNRVTYDMIGVTGACLMVAREKYEEVGGLDETMAVAYNDVDFCFKLVEAGYYNVQRNDVVLYHHESFSRGLDEQSAGKWERLLEEKANLYAKHSDMEGKDSFYHKELVDNASDYICNYKFAYEDCLRTQPVEPLGQSFLKKARQGKLRLTVDRAQPQQKIHQEEPDILWIMGWNYIPGEDNGLYDKTLVLQKMNGSGYRAVPAVWYRKDVEAILPGESHVELAGFVLRVLQKDLEQGEYRIGMVCRRLGGEKRGQKLIAWSEQTLIVP